MRKRSRRPEYIKHVVNNIIGRIEKQGPEKKERIIKGWQKIVGEKASGHTRPVNIKQGKLTIETDSSTWFYTLNLKKRSILKGIKKELSEYKIEDIRFRMGNIT